MRASITPCVLLTAAVLAVTPAHADAPPPDGRKFVGVTHHVTNTASVPASHTLALVTTRRSEAEYLRVKWTGLEGDVDVPGGYMLATRYVALTPPQLAELAALYAAALPEGDATRTALQAASDADRPALMAKTPIAPGADLSTVAAFFRGDGVAASPVLPHRTTIDDGDPRDTVRQEWTMDGLKDGAVALLRVASKEDDSGSGCGRCAGGTGGGWVPAALLLTVVGWLLRRRRASPLA